MPPSSGPSNDRPVQGASLDFKRRSPPAAGGRPAREQGIDGRELLRRNLVDALAVTSIRTDPVDPLASVERSVRDFMREVGGRCKVYMPILNYNFSERRPSYGQLAQWVDTDEAAMVRRLLALYDRCGADGVVMECVDYGNYSDAVCRAIRDYRRGDWKEIEAAGAAPTAGVQSFKMRSACMNKDVPLTVLLPSDYARYARGNASRSCSQREARTYFSASPRHAFL